jgi:hypothetical protein
MCSRPDFSLTEKIVHHKIYSGLANYVEPCVFINIYSSLQDKQKKKYATIRLTGNFQ